MEDWHNFGPDYDRTLMAWHKNFVDAGRRRRCGFWHEILARPLYLT